CAGTTVCVADRAGVAAGARGLSCASATLTPQTTAMPKTTCFNKLAIVLSRVDDCESTKAGCRPTVFPSCSTSISEGEARTFLLRLLRRAGVISSFGKFQRRHVVDQLDQAI